MRRLFAAAAVLLLSACKQEAGDEVSALRAKPPLPQAAESLLAQGHTEYNKQEFESARDLWLAILPRATRAQDSILEGELYTWLGLAAYRLGNLDSAWTWEKRAIAIKTRLQNPHELWRSYNALGLIALDDNLNDSAAVLFEKASAIATADSDSEGVAKATGNAALAYSYLGDLARARAGHRSMRAAGKLLHDAKVEANGLANEAMVDIWEGDPLSAISRLDTARRMYRVRRDAVGEANALGQLATAYELTGDFSVALSSLDSALTLTKKHSLASNTIEILRLFGNLHARLGDYRRSLAFFEDAEKEARASGADGDLASVFRGAALSSLRLGNARRARSYAETALRLHREAEEPLDEIDDLLLLADVEATSRNDAAASRLLDSAAAGAASSANAVARAVVLSARAQLAERNGQHAQAVALIREMDRGDAVSSFELRATASATASRAFARLGVADSALIYGARAVDAVERVRGGLAAPALRSSFVSDRAHVYSEYVLALLRAGKTEAGFAIADRARSRALVENLGALRSQRGDRLPGELVESERVLRRIDALMEALARTTPPRSDVRGLVVTDAAAPIVKRLAAARAEYERMQIRFAERSEPVAAVLNQSAVDLSQVMRVLAPDEAAVEYFLGTDTLVTFVVTRGAVRVVRTGVEPGLIAHRLRILKDLWGGPRTDWAAGLGVSRALHSELIAPIQKAGWLKGVRRLVIIPHGMLAQIPYAGLNDRQSHRFLIDQFHLGQAPSAAALVALRLRPRPDTRTRTVALAPFGRELPGTIREVTMVASIGTWTVHRNEKATEAVLRRGLRAGEVIHVASHGVLNHLNPMFSRVDLSHGDSSTTNNGRLEVHELLGLEVRSPLVFLSGCETGASEEWGDGALRMTGDLTLSQAFLSAGARNVASTLWRIDDDGAAEMARRFYVSVRTAPLFEALSRAQRSMAADRKFGNPYYWAAYVISGDGGRISEPQGSRAASVH